MRTSFFIVFLLQSALIFGQYTIDKIFVDGNVSDTTYCKEDSVFRMVNGQYVFSHKKTAKEFMAWSALLNKPSTYTPAPHTHLKSEVGLDNVDNTSDLNKPISTAVQTALNAKQNSLGFTAVPDTRTVNGKALNANISVTASDVGLSNVDNTSDANKPVSTATQTALNNKSTIYFGTDAGANDSYVITASPVPASYTTGMVVMFKANTQNTTACSINVNGLGVKNIVKRVNTTPATGDILALMFCMLVYDGTNFVLLNPVVN